MEERFMWILISFILAGLWVAALMAYFQLRGKMLYVVRGILAEKESSNEVQRLMLIGRIQVANTMKVILTGRGITPKR